MPRGGQRAADESGDAGYGHDRANGAFAPFFQFSNGLLNGIHAFLQPLNAAFIISNFSTQGFDRFIKLLAADFCAVLIVENLL